MMARYGGGAMDMRQHSGGALSANSLQFSPQAALSNENYFLLDPIQSPSSSMDFAGLNSFASQLTSEFSSSFLESTSQNSFTTNLDSAVGGILGQAQTQNGLLLPADEWSGTTNSVGANSSQQQQHSHQISSPNQGQSSLSQGSLAQSVVIDRKKPLQGSYEGCLAASQIGQEAFVAQPSSNSKDLNQGEDFQSGQGGLQGMVHQASFQGSQLPQGAALQLMYQNQGQKSDFQRGNMCQQPFLKPAIATNALELSSQDSFHEGQVAGQPLGFEHTQSLNQPVNFDVAQKPDLHSGIQVYRGAQGDSSVADYQATNQQAFRQIGQIVNQPMKLTGGGLPHQSGFQTDEGIQLMRGLGLQIQGKSPQTSLQAQMTNQYMNFSGQTVAGHHSPNIAAQQSLLQAQTVADQHSSFHSQSTAQAQAVNQQAAVNQQSVYQARQLPSGGHQQLFHASEQASFHSGQSLVKQAHVMSNNQGLHLHGAQQMLAQLQPRLLNPIFQGLKAGRRQILPGSSTGGATFFGSGADGTQRSPMPGAIVSRCVQVLLMYIQEQRKRPADNDILFWRNLVREFFVPGATKRWCLTSYNSSPMGRHAQGLFPMDYWFCNLCGVQPGRGFESSTDVLPRLFKIKYDSGLMEELLFLDMAEERYMLPSGKLVLEFPQAVHESIFPELRVVRYGRLKVTFSSSFKISSWEFCTKIHEEVVPRKNLLQQAQQLAKLVMDTDQEGFDENAGILKSHCNEFTSTAKQLALKLDAPNVNDLGFSKRYVRCLQIAEVVNSMKDLISFERKTGLGPIESLARFPTIRKMQSETSLLEASHGTMNQVINQLTQGTPNGNSAYAQLLSRPSLPQTQGQVSNQLQSSLLQGIDNAVSRSSTSLNQLQIQFRNHLEARNSSLLHQQFSSQMQPPAVQSESCNQLTHFTTQEMSPLQSQLLSQAQSQLSSQASGQLSLNFGQMGQQIYESAGTKQIVHHHSNQVLSQSHSLNQAGQQSLPGTPQSEMSDMRSNA